LAFSSKQNNVTVCPPLYSKSKLRFTVDLPDVAKEKPKVKNEKVKISSEKSEEIFGDP